MLKLTDTEIQEIHTVFNSLGIAHSHILISFILPTRWSTRIYVTQEMELGFLQSTLVPYMSIIHLITSTDIFGRFLIQRICSPCELDNGIPVVGSFGFDMELMLHQEKVSFDYGLKIDLYKYPWTYSDVANMWKVFKSFWGSVCYVTVQIAAKPYFESVKNQQTNKQIVLIVEQIWY